MTLTASGDFRALLERDDSLAALSAQLTAVRSSGQGRMVLVGGEAGVGKTALLREFCDGLERPVRILRGACEPLRTPRPFGPLWDIADVVDGALKAQLSASARPYEIAAALLEELKGSRSTVIVLEDVHWADEATLDVLMMLAPRLNSVPALALASYRDDELDRAEQLRFVLGELVRRPGRLMLAPLSQQAVVQLAARHDLDPHELHARTGGNPFFVTEVLAAGRDQIPETVRDAVLSRASRLSEPARRVLEAVAIVPGQAELWLLEQIAGEHLDHLEECLTAGMLTAPAAHVAFRHELARLAVEEATHPRRRLALHGAALVALTAQPDERLDYSRLVHHAEGTGDLEAVLRWAPIAADRASAAGAHREAVDQYARALKADDQLPIDRRAELCSRHAHELYTVGRIDEAIEAQHSALGCHRRLGDRLAEGDGLRSLARLLFFTGRAEEGERAMADAVELLETLPPGRELAMAYANVSQRRMVVEDYEAAAVWGRRAIELARGLGDSETVAYALTSIGSAELNSDRDRGAATLNDALALALRGGLDEHVGRIYNALVQWPVRMRDFHFATTHLEDGLAFCAERGQDMWRLYLLADRARMELDLGRWDDAADSAATVLHDPRSAPVARGWALATLGLVRARRGDAQAAEPLLEASELVRNTTELMRIVPVAAARAELAWLQGDQAAVRSVTDGPVAYAREGRSPWATGELVYWRWQAGIADDIEAAVLAEPYRLSIVGDHDQAAERWRALGCPYEAALAAAASDDESAVVRSIEQLQQMAAKPAAAIISRRLRERGVRGVPRGPRASTKENPAGLTARELEVLPLLAAGLRNAQIANRLVVSQKTVDHHVSSILRKLGVSNRGEAAAEATRLGLN